MVSGAIGSIDIHSSNEGVVPRDASLLPAKVLTL